MGLSLKNIFSSIQAPEQGSPESVVGVDIGSSSIKVVEIMHTEKALMLRTYGELQLGPYADKPLGESVSLEQKSLTEALVDVIRESGVKAQNSVLAIPLDSSFVTVVPVTVKKGEKLEAKINVESRKYIPVPLAEVILDWSELGQYGDSDEEVHEVLLAAIQNDAFARYQELMATIKMVAQPSEIEVFSTIRGTFHSDDTTLAVLDLGAEASKLFIAKDGALERIHRVYEGGTNCTKRIAHLLDVPFAEAEEMKRTYSEGAEHARDIYKAYISSLERSILEFKRVIDQYETRSGEKIARTVITGGAAQFPSVIPYVQDALSREVTMVNPFDKVAYPAFMEDTLSEIGVTFSTALGAALRPFEMGS